ncbi:group 2 glycosyl transferase [Dialister sp. CAG:588]|nr:group 2 glycosyl transferase [Dialister sp. CAG:588]
MYEPLISIIVPVYKVEKYIHRCIESVLHQTYTNWELILVDDGSPDSCGRICDEYAMYHDKIAVIHKINQGVGAARNTGLHRAEGEWIYFLDSDDFIKEDTLEKMITFSNEGFYDIVMAGHSILKSSGKFIPCSDSWNESDDTSTIQKKILLDELPNFSCGKLYKRILWENVYFPVDMLIEDMYINPTLFYRAKHICIHKEALYYYSYENTDSIMRSKTRKTYIYNRYCRFLAWEEHIRIASIYEADLVPVCTRKALLAAIKALLLYYGIGCKDSRVDFTSVRFYKKASR